MSDPYKVLGVAKSATQDEIKQAYRKLAKKLHPDLHPGDRKVEERFKQVSAANALLSDANARARYDRGEIDASGAQRPEQHFYRSYAESGDGAKYSSGFGGFNMEDIFADLFADVGRGGERRRPGDERRGPRVHMRGADVKYAVQVGFLEAALGATKRITLPDGRALDVTIPEGIADGQTIRLKGQGSPGMGDAKTGDALVEVRVTAHARFTRVGLDIHLDLPVTLPEAVLGAKVTVATVHGPVSMTIPKNSNSGDTLRLKGKGVRDAKTRKRGNQYVKLRVALPDPPDPELNELIKRWAKEHPYRVRSD